MITYSCNWMGPINTKWIEENGDGWSGGRIDISGIPDSHYGEEYALPIMRNEDWCLFCEWVSKVSTEKQVEFKELIEWFEKDNDYKIQWFDEPTW